MNIHVLSRGVLIDQGHLLLAPRPHPYHYDELNTPFYYLPGGHMIFKNLPSMPLIREIKEETGFDATIEKFLGIMEHAWHFPGDEVCCHTHEMNVIFKINVAELKFGDTIPQKEAHVAFKWVSIDALEGIDLRPSPLKSALFKWLACPDPHVFWSTIE